MSHESLERAKAVQDDEYMTYYKDVEEELKHYDFSGKTVFCPCDNRKSSFYKYFRDNFDRLGLKELIISIKDIPRCAVWQHYNKNDGLWIHVYKEGDGDFRHWETRKLLERCDVIVTNPPFSLFREFFRWCAGSGKEYLILGPLAAVGYRIVFDEIKAGNCSCGINKNRRLKFYRTDSQEDRITEGGLECVWLTNMKNDGIGKKKLADLNLMNMLEQILYNKALSRALNRKYGAIDYPVYDNYPAIEVPVLSGIPLDYEGVMGVPITILKYYEPDKIELVKVTDPHLQGKNVFKRIFIRWKKH